MAKSVFEELQEVLDRKFQEGMWEFTIVVPKNYEPESLATEMVALDNAFQQVMREMLGDRSRERIAQEIGDMVQGLMSVKPEVFSIDNEEDLRPIVINRNDFDSETLTFEERVNVLRTLFHHNYDPDYVCKKDLPGPNDIIH